MTPAERDDGQVINRSLIILQATMHVRGMRSHTLVCKRGKGAGNLHCCHYAVRLHNYLQKLTKQLQTLKLPTEVVISAQDRILRCDWSYTAQCSATKLPNPFLLLWNRVGLCETRVEGGPTSHESSGFGPRWTRTIYSCRVGKVRLKCMT